jgi:1-acyl-sn-glycerol-3-phosphate acyltransferase
MTRTIWTVRGRILLLLAGYACWMLPAGLLAAEQLSGFAQDGSYPRVLAVLGIGAGLCILLNALLMARLADLAVRARWPVLPVLTMASLVGLVALVVGAMAGANPVLGLPSFGFRAGFSTWQWLCFASGIALAVTLLLQPTVPATNMRFFLWNRSHSANWDARRALAAGFGQALLLVLAVGWVAAPAKGNGAHSPQLLWFLLSYAAGVLLSAIQKFPIRQCGFLPIGGFLTTVALAIHWIMPGVLWPTSVLGIALGLMHVPARNYLLISVPPSQRLSSVALFACMQIVGAAAAIALLQIAPHWIWFLAAVSVTLLTIRLLFREMFEQIVEVVIWPLYRIKAFGPGASLPPMRGPVIVLANHSAWFDPLWLCKVVPNRIRPMMTARFYDLPGVRWLMKNVVRTIRVSEPRFRREMPEVKEAIAGLAQGDAIMIFPEGWLRRKEDHSLRRFGQGIHQLLKAHPETPVVVCWIEGGWKSYASYWMGLPTKNKRMDLWRHIRIGISAPEVLKPELLADHRATRRYLMQACLQARAFLGLPPMPAPSFVSNGEEEEKEEVCV